MALQALERDFFRTLNRYVEPAARAGLFSSRFAPGGMIVLETPGESYSRPRSFSSAIGRITGLLAQFTTSGWAFAILKTEAA